LGFFFPGGTCGFLAGRPKDGSSFFSDEKGFDHAGELVVVEKPLVSTT
jgi:hypothetical protein